MLLLNVGPTRADQVPQVEKIEIPSGAALRDVVRAVLGSEASADPVVADMLQSGITKPPPEDEDDTVPRAVG